MKKIQSLKMLPLLLIAIGLVVTAAFAQSNSGTQKQFTDTIPAKQKKVRDLDEAMMQIERAELEMQRAMKEIDQVSLEKEIKEAMKTMEIDMAKMKEDMAKAMKEIDTQKINAEVQKAMKEIDSEKIKIEMETAMAKVNMEQVKAEMEKVKAMDFSKMKEELAAVQPQLEQAMKEANESMAKAKKEMTAYKNLVNALEKDGLLSKGGNYKIEYRNKQLTVNGKTLSVEDTKKYNEFVGDKKDFTLEKDEDGVNIDH